VDKKLSPAEITIVASGLATFVFSFVTWFGKDPFTVNGWDNFPLFTYAALCGIAMAAVILVTKFGNVQLPSNVAGFTWTQIHQVLGLFAVLDTLGVFIAGDDAKIGLLLSVVASIGLLVGSVMLRNERPAH
jgi:cytochrome bd-type quinol oxidase subunit 2